MIDTLLSHLRHIYYGKGWNKTKNSGSQEKNGLIWVGYGTRVTPCNNGARTINKPNWTQFLGRHFPLQTWHDVTKIWLRHKEGFVWDKYRGQIWPQFPRKPLNQLFFWDYLQIWFFTFFTVFEVFRSRTRGNTYPKSFESDRWETKPKFPVFRNSDPSLIMVRSFFWGHLPVNRSSVGQSAGWNMSFTSLVQAFPTSCDKLSPALPLYPDSWLYKDYP